MLILRKGVCISNIFIDETMVQLSYESNFKYGISKLIEEINAHLLFKTYKEYENSNDDYQAVIIYMFNSKS